MSGTLAAAAWAEMFELIDRQLSPLGLAAIDALAPARGSLVIDIGCGAGQTLLQLAERVGPEGRVVGVDIAPRLLEVARRRTAALGQVELVEADAQALTLSTSGVDAIFSRFGVMAFADPAMAFANFRRMLKPSGVLAFCCWRSLAENELDALPVAAAGLTAMVDEGPFSFADPDHLRRLLEAAGFGDITIRAHDEAVSSGDLDAMVAVLLKVGALGRIVRENPDLRREAETRLRRALLARGDPSRVALMAAVWIVVAKP
ncbi:methyltransferase domain-containing protein [Caulobacter sp. 1776]|uniref:class I SAM-dependent methyltransferase n=1 Tax=Caulobacter sp. 1776 TaxID=3156420 RepID=UPI0033992A35